MPRAIVARLLLIFALLFAQTGGMLHEISHKLANQTQDHSLSHGKHCDQCAAYAQLGAALGSPSIHFSPDELRHNQFVTTLANTVSTAAFDAFAARAPPHSA